MERRVRSMSSERKEAEFEQLAKEHEEKENEQRSWMKMKNARKAVVRSLL